MVESRRLLVVDPLERHAGDVGAQHQLRQPARRGGRHYAQVVQEAVIGTLEIDAQHSGVRYGSCVHEFNNTRS